MEASKNEIKKPEIIIEKMQNAQGINACILHNIALSLVSSFSNFPCLGGTSLETFYDLRADAVVEGLVLALPPLTTSRDGLLIWTSVILYEHCIFHPISSIILG